MDISYMLIYINTRSILRILNRAEEELEDAFVELVMAWKLIA